MAFGSNESVEFDIKVNGKQAEASINDVEDAQEKLDKTVSKTSKNIKANWTAIGAAITVSAAAATVLIARSAKLEQAMFGLNKEQKEWIEQASERYAVDQEMIAGFVQMGKASGLAGKEIEQITAQAFAMSKQFANLGFDSSVEDLTEFYSAGTLTGAVLEYMEKTTGDAEIATRDLDYQMKALKASTAGVYEEWAKTDAAKMARSLQELDTLSLDLGNAFFRLSGETGILNKSVWVAEKAFLGLELAFNGWLQIYYLALNALGDGTAEAELSKLATKAKEIREILGGQEPMEISLELPARTPLGRPPKETDTVEKTKEVSRQIKDIWKNDTQEISDMHRDMMSNMSRGLEEFVMTGKMDFKDLANSMIADIVRAQSQALVSGLFGSLFGGGLSSATSNVVGMFHAGGFVGSPIPSHHDGSLRQDERIAKLQTGEAVISRSGVSQNKEAIQAINNGQTVGGGGNNTTAEIIFNVQAIDSTTFQAWLTANRQTVESIISNSISSNGSVRRVIKSSI